ncbi:radiation-inducible immediate-early gene IEX-1-like [Narcine bancroftii]|uniref:radiation-inducible immediate-early gene IEX-1-like n=1 Tax=Narcine bancroftii TaxID=1343680 RepID=UPI003831FA99
MSSLYMTGQLSQFAVSQASSVGFAGRKPTLPRVFTFEPMREIKKLNRRKKRHLKVLYPPRQARRVLPTQRDLAKRLLLFLLSIVLFQIYTATEDDVNVVDPEIASAEDVPLASAEAAAPSTLVASVVLEASPEAESNCSLPLAGGEPALVPRSFLACRM